MIYFESKVKKWFSNHGYEISKIPESNEKSPDFLIADDTSTFLLELKTKFLRKKRLTREDKYYQVAKYTRSTRQLPSKRDYLRSFRKQKINLRIIKKRKIS
jgi:hypothetical protein